MSLVSEANQGQLPLNQFMDIETLNWIESNNPFSADSTGHWEIPLNNLTKYRPKEAWFNDSSRVETIHGQRHLIRVTIYSFIIVEKYYPELESKLDEVLVAASLHDIKRFTDKTDEGHALVSAEWFIHNLHEVENTYNIELSEDKASTIYEAILSHERPYSEEELYTTDNTPGILDVLKTADALDRYVQPKLKWWLDDSYLRLVPSIALKSFAFWLVTKSERLHLNGTTNSDSIYKILKNAK